MLSYSQRYCDYLPFGIKKGLLTVREEQESSKTGVRTTLAARAQLIAMREAVLSVTGPPARVGSSLLSFKGRLQQTPNDEKLKK